MVESAFLIGQDPHPSTPVTSESSTLGMTHGHSPLYASDHRGVVTKLRFQCPAPPLPVLL